MDPLVLAEIPFFSHGISLYICIVGLIGTALSVLSFPFTGINKEPLGPILIWMISSDFLFYLGKTVGSLEFEKNQTICDTVQAISFFGLLSSRLWAAFSAHVLFASLKNEKQPTSNMRIYQVTALVVPAIWITAEVATEYVEGSAQKCVHVLAEGVFDWQVFMFQAVPWTTLSVLTLAWYLRAFYQVRSYFKDEKCRGGIALIYPAIVICCWAPAICMYWLQSMGIRPKSGSVEWLLAVNKFQGIFDIIMYGLSRRVRKKLTCKSRSKKKDEELQNASEESRRREEEMLEKELRNRVISKQNTGLSLQQSPKVINNDSFNSYLPS